MYYRCKLLDSGIVEFGYEKVDLCNRCAHTGGGNISCVKYDDAQPKLFEFNIEMFIKKKKEVYFSFQKGECYPLCEGCIDLYRSSVLPEVYDTIFDNFVLHYWTKCNSNCIYCYTNEDKKYYNTRTNYKLLPILKQMDKEGHIGYQGYVNFAGGEVSCLGEFDEVLKIFKKYDYFVLFNTSAVKYEENIARELTKNNALLIVSVDSGSEKTFKKIKQVDTYKKVWRNLEKYVQKSASSDLVFLKYIFVESINCNKEEVKKFLLKSKSIGVKNVIFDIDWNWLIKRKEFITYDLIQLFYFAFDEAQKMEMKVLLYDNAAVLFSEGKYKDDFWESYIFSHNDDYSGAKFKKVLCFFKDQPMQVYSHIRHAVDATGIEYKKIKMACNLARNLMPVILEDKFYIYKDDYKKGMENILDSPFRCFYELLPKLMNFKK